MIHTKISVLDGVIANADVSVIMYTIVIVQLDESSMKRRANANVNKAESKSAWLEEDISITRAASVPKEDILLAEVWNDFNDILGFRIIRPSCFWASDVIIANPYRYYSMKIAGGANCWNIQVVQCSTRVTGSRVPGVTSLTFKLSYNSKCTLNLLIIVSYVPSVDVINNADSPALVAFPVASYISAKTKNTATFVWCALIWSRLITHHVMSPCHLALQHWSIAWIDTRKNFPARNILLSSFTLGNPCNHLWVGEILKRGNSHIWINV